MSFLTRNLKLRIAEDLTADARYNLERLDLLGANIDLSEGLVVGPGSITDAEVSSSAAINADKIDDSNSINKFVSSSTFSDISNNTLNIASLGDALNVTNTRVSTVEAEQVTQNSSISGLQLSDTIQSGAIAVNTTKVSFPEAPADGQQYARQGNSWSVVVPPEDSSGGTVNLTSNTLNITGSGTENITVELPVGVGAGNTVDASITSIPPTPPPSLGLFPEDGFVSGSTPIPSQMLSPSVMTTIQYSSPTQGNLLFDGIQYTAQATGMYYFDASIVIGNDVADAGAGMGTQFLVNSGRANERVEGFRRKTNSNMTNGIYGLHSSQPISLIQGDTVEFQAAHIDSTVGDFPSTTFTNFSTFTPITFTAAEIPMGHFDVVFLGAEIESEVVTATLTVDQLPVNDAGGVALGSKFDIEGISLDVQGSVVNGSFVARLGGVYKFDSDLSTPNSGTTRLSTTYRVNRINGTTETYVSSSPDVQGANNSLFSNNPNNHQALLRLAIGETVDFFYHGSNNIGGGLQEILAGSSVAVTRVSDSSSYVNAYDTRSAAIPAVSIVEMEALVELEDVQSAFSGGAFTAPVSGSYFIKASFGWNTPGTSGDAPGMVLVLRRNGVVFDFKAAGGSGAVPHFLSENICRMYRLEAGDVITASMGVSGYNINTSNPITEIHPSTSVGASTEIFGGFQATLVTNDAPPVPVLLSVPAVDPSGNPVFQNAPLASEVVYNNTTSGLTATDVQAAIDELRALIASLHP